MGLEHEYGLSSHCSEHHEALNSFIKVLQQHKFDYDSILKADTEPVPKKRQYVLPTDGCDLWVKLPGAKHHRCHRC